MQGKPIPVVRVILSLEGRILLLERSSKEEYGVGRYCLPGGKVDYGVTVEEACRSEVREETGLEISDLQFLFYQDSLPRSGEDLHVINLYFSANHNGEVDINDESDSYEWVTSNELSDYDIAFGNRAGIIKNLNDHQ